ncbi:MAG: tyrosine-type recombinase/integrase [Bacteroidota bacterium]
MEAKAVVYKKSIIIYYKKNKDTLRFPTGITKIPSDIYYFKEGRLTPKNTNYKSKNELILSILQPINEFILKYKLANAKDPSVAVIKEFLANKSEKVEVIESKVEQNQLSFEVFYNKMFDEKKLEAIQPSSLKDYKSTLNSLLLYQHIKSKKKLTLENINSADFLKKFEKFLSEKQTDKDGKSLENFKTVGGLNVNTVKKRISTTTTFLRYCHKSKEIDFSISPGVDMFKTQLKKFRPTLTIITKEEQQQLLALNLQGDEEKLRDILIFLCLTGLRYSDLLTLHKDFIRGGYIIKEAQKTGIQFKIPLTKKATELIKKYNCNFNIFSTQQFNLNIKELLKEHNICTEIINIKNKVYSTTVYTQKVKYKEIGTHTGRRSFVANCIINGFPIPEIMGFTGHSQLSSFQCYVDQFQVSKNELEKIQALD